MSVLIHAAVGVFISVVLCISITPLRELTQNVAVCSGADQIVRDERNGQGLGKVIEMECVYDEGAIKQVGNDKAVVGGIGVSALAGIVLGLIGGLFWRRLEPTPR